jgi:hypothetical protein
MCFDFRSFDPSQSVQSILDWKGKRFVRKETGSGSMDWKGMSFHLILELTQRISHGTDRARVVRADLNPKDRARSTRTASVETDFGRVQVLRELMPGEEAGRDDPPLKVKRTRRKFINEK